MEAGSEATGPVGLVLAGGGARGAYEIGALSALLPAVAKEEGETAEKVRHWRPDVIVGTSVGAINASYLAATAEQELETSLRHGREIWEQLMRWENVLKPILSLDQMRAIVAAIGDLVDVRGARAWRLVDPSPLEHSLTHRLPGLPDGIPFDHIEANVKAGTITAAAVVATLASTSLSRVFFSSSRPRAPRDDARRGISYVRAKLGKDHVLASAAIPCLFPARPIEDRAGRKRWYVDGGTRLNTPISPTLKLGARRLIIVALNCPLLGEYDEPDEDSRPEILDGASQLLQAVLIDPLVNDLLTLARINDLLRRRPAPEEENESERYVQEVPYILVAPDHPHRIGEIAVDVFEDRYMGRFNRRRLGTVGRLGHSLDVPGNPVRGELFSHLFFDEQFAVELIRQGRCDAQRWLDEAAAGKHEKGLWRLSEPPAPAAVAAAAETVDV